MYQICTSTTVNTGEHRGLTVTRKRVVSRANVALPGTAETTGGGLITRRSQVQILPPPRKRPGQRLFLTWSLRASATTMQPVATQLRRRARRTTADRDCVVDRDQPTTTAGVRDAARRCGALEAFEPRTRRSGLRGPSGSTRPWICRHLVDARPEARGRSRFGAFSSSSPCYSTARAGRFRCHGDGVGDQDGCDRSG
jgi:hypothetical protein